MKVYMDLEIRVVKSVKVMSHCLVMENIIAYCEREGVTILKGSIGLPDKRMERQVYPHYDMFPLATVIEIWNRDYGMQN